MYQSGLFLDHVLCMLGEPCISQGCFWTMFCVCSESRVSVRAVSGPCSVYARRAVRQSGLFLDHVLCMLGEPCISQGCFWTMFCVCSESRVSVRAVSGPCSVYARRAVHQSGLFLDHVLCMLGEPCISQGCFWTMFCVCSESRASVRAVSGPCSVYARRAVYQSGLFLDHVLCMLGEPCISQGCFWTMFCVCSESRVSVQGCFWTMFCVCSESRASVRAVFWTMFCVCSESRVSVRAVFWTMFCVCSESRASVRAVFWTMFCVCSESRVSVRAVSGPCSVYARRAVYQSGLFLDHVLCMLGEPCISQGCFLDHVLCMLELGGAVYQSGLFLDHVLCMLGEPCISQGCFWTMFCVCSESRVSVRAVSGPCSVYARRAVYQSGLFLDHVLCMLGEPCISQGCFWTMFCVCSESRASVRACFWTMFCVCSESRVSVRAVSGPCSVVCSESRVSVRAVSGPCSVYARRAVHQSGLFLDRVLCMLGEPCISQGWIWTVFCVCSESRASVRAVSGPCSVYARRAVYQSGLFLDHVLCMLGEPCISQGCFWTMFCVCSESRVSVRAVSGPCSVYARRAVYQSGLFLDHVLCMLGEPCISQGCFWTMFCVCSESRASVRGCFWTMFCVCSESRVSVRAVSGPCSVYARRAVYQSGLFLRVSSGVSAHADGVLHVRGAEGHQAAGDAAALVELRRRRAQGPESLESSRGAAQGLQILRPREDRRR